MQIVLMVLNKQFGTKIYKQKRNAKSITLSYRELLWAFNSF